MAHLNTKTKTKTTIEFIKRTNTCYIFGKQGVQGYQLSPFDQSTGQFVVGQPDHTRPDKDFNLANLILELAFLFYSTVVPELTRPNWARKVREMGKESFWVN